MGDSRRRRAVFGARFLGATPLFRDPRGWTFADRRWGSNPVLRTDWMFLAVIGAAHGGKRDGTL